MATQSTHKSEIGYCWSNTVSDEYMAIIGKKESFNITEVKFFNLDPLDKVIQIGDASRGGQATLNRETRFKPYVIYRGIMNIEGLQSGNKITEVLVFEVRKEDTPKIVLDKGDTYLVGFMILKGKPWEENELTAKFGLELKNMNPTTGNLRIYKPIFKKYEINKQS